ncbi:MAG TPA: hypothetical protein VM490_01695 [Armatimonadaceae bacterium]|nr:hypothetical protein [Armatimonadaceae bacterium]
MRNSRNTGLLLAAAIGGGLYWASKQPGGVKGTMDRLNGKLKEISDSENPLATIKGKYNDWQSHRTNTGWNDQREVQSIEPMPADSAAAAI